MKWKLTEYFDDGEDYVLMFRTSEELQRYIEQVVDLTNFDIEEQEDGVQD